MSVEELAGDPAFDDIVKKAESAGEIVSYLKERGFDISEQELKSGFESMQEGELSESSLESVSGGVWIPWICRYIYNVRGGGNGFSGGGGGGSR